MQQNTLSRRAFMRLAATVAGGALAAACVPAAAPQAGGEGGAGQAGAAPAEIGWYVRSSPTENPWQRDLVLPRFQELNPDIEVNLIVTPHNEAAAKLLAMNSAGDTPDIWANNFGAGFTSGLGLEMIRPLSDQIEASDLITLDDYGQPVIDLFTHAGKVWAVPFMTCGSFLFYNKDIFDEAGIDYPSSNWDDQTWTWEKMVETASQLTKNYGQGADAQYGLLFWRYNAWYAFPWLWGTDPFTPEEYVSGYPCQINLTSEEAVAAMQAAYDLIYTHKVSPPPADQDSIEAGGNPFLTGQVVMNMTGGWGFWGMREFTDFRWGAAAMPWQATNADPLWPDANMISRTSKAPEAAWKLIEYISGGEGLRGYVQATNAQPAARSLWEDWYALFEDKIPREELQAGMEGSIKYGKMPYSHTMADSDKMYTVLTQQLDPLWLDEKGVAETLTAAEAAVQEMIAANCGQTLEDAANRIVESM
jgi:multiple sugar transport system substrate-binding protein